MKGRSRVKLACKRLLPFIGDHIGWISDACAAAGRTRAAVRMVTNHNQAA